MTPLKVEDDGQFLIDEVNKKYVPFISLNSEYFKQQEKTIKFGIHFENGVLLGMKKTKHWNDFGRVFINWSYGIIYK